MSILPEWAPNLHPLVIHFPIALLFIAALVDTIGLLFKTKPMWKNTAFLLYVLGAIAAVGALFSGKQAADSVFLATEANALLTEHADLAHWVVYFFGGYALIRAIVFFAKLDERMGPRFIVFLIGVGGLSLLWMTADHGAQLVYQYGVGVQAVDTTPSVAAVMADSSNSSAPQRNMEGGWSWKPTRASAWAAGMTVYGTAAESSLRDGGEFGDVLGLTTNGDAVMYTFDFPMTTLQLDARLNLDDFSGTVMFVHHVIDEHNYSFMSLADGEMKLGRSQNSDLYLMANDAFTPKGWVSYRVVADQTHFRSYADQKLVSHGHGDDQGSGLVGIRLNGTGTVLVDFVQTVSLRGEGREDGAAGGETASEGAEHQH